MADMDDEDYEECLDAIYCLKKENERLKESFMRIDKFQSEANKFRKILSDNTDAVNVTDYPPLDTFDSIDRYVTEELKALRASMADIEDKMDPLKNVYDLWFRDERYVCNLVTEIRNIQDSIRTKIKDFDNNKDIKLIMEMLEIKRKEWGKL